MKKIIVIASTGGGILSKVLSVPSVRESIAMVVSDRQCGALNVAERFKIPNLILESKTGVEFCEKLIDRFDEKSFDSVISFYTRLLSSSFLSKFDGKVLNMHPSVLPACPGLDGFGDTVKSGSKFIGATLHFVDEGVDTGKPLMQSIYPYLPNKTVEENRHRVFVQQCKMFIQFVEWLNSGRIAEEQVNDAHYEFSEFIPNLDSEIAKSFDV